jgi:hypothetical protein
MLKDARQSLRLAMTTEKVAIWSTMQTGLSGDLSSDVGRRLWPVVAILCRFQASRSSFHQDNGATDGLQ